MLDGNIFGAQSLVIYDQLYKLVFEDSELSKKEFFERPPIANSLFLDLWKYYVSYKNQFADRVAFCESAMSMNPSNKIDENKVNKDKFARWFQAIGGGEKTNDFFEEMISQAINDNNDDWYSQEENRIANLPIDAFINKIEILKSKSSTDTERWQFIALSCESILVDYMQLLKKVVNLGDADNIYNHLATKIEALKELNSNMPEPRKSLYRDYLKFLLDQVKMTASMLKEDLSDENILKLVLKTSFLSKYKKTAALVEQIGKNKFDGVGIDLINESFPKKENWWSADFLDREICALTYLVLCINKNPQSEADILNRINKWDEILRDSNGYVFLPAVCLISLITEKDQSGFHQRLSEEFERNAKIDYKTYLNSKNN